MQALDPGRSELRDVCYGEVQGVSLLMDIVMPDPRPETPVPAVVLLHGGGWAQGNRADMFGRAVRLAQHGYVGVTVGYRLAGKAPFPAQLQDCKCAVRYLRAHAAQYGVDPDRIGAWGCSAGGHLASMLGLTENMAEFEGEGGNGQTSSAVQLVIDCFGPSDFPTWQETVNKLARDPVAQRLFGPSGPEKNLKWQDHFALDTDAGVVAFFAGKSGEDTRSASPVTYARRKQGAPPFLIVHGTQDAWVPVQQSVLLAEALDAAGKKVTFLLKPNMGHDETMAFPEIFACIEKVFAGNRSD